MAGEDGTLWTTEHMGPGDMDGPVRDETRLQKDIRKRGPHPGTGTAFDAEQDRSTGRSVGTDHHHPSHDLFHGITERQPLLTASASAYGRLFSSILINRCHTTSSYHGSLRHGRAPTDRATGIGMRYCIYDGTMGSFSGDMHGIGVSDRTAVWIASSAKGHHSAVIYQ